MPTKREQAAKEPPEDEKPKKRRSRAASTQGSPNTQPEANQLPDQNQEEVQSPEPKGGRQTQNKGAGPTQTQPVAETSQLSQILQQQISQAIAPVIAEFRQNMAQALQTETGSPPETNGRNTQQDKPETLLSDRSETQSEGKPEAQPPQAASSQEAQPPQQDQQPQQDQSQSQPPQEAQSPQQAQQQTQSPQQAQSETQSPRQQTGTESSGTSGKTGDSGSESDGSGKHGIAGLVKGGAQSAVGGALHLAEKQGERWMEAMIVAGVDALLTEKTHDAVQHRAREGLHMLIQKTFDSLPNGAKNPELQSQTERTLQAILREAVDAVFADTVRSDIEQHGKQAAGSLIHRNLSAALDAGKEALQRIVEAVVNVLRRQWQRVLRLLLKLILLALEDSLAPGEKDELPDTATEPRAVSPRPATA